MKSTFHLQVASPRNVVQHVHQVVALVGKIIVYSGQVEKVCTAAKPLRRYANYRLEHPVYSHRLHTRLCRVNCTRFH